MILSPKDRPIFLNPTFPELLELANSRWDSIRICVDDERNVLLMASGYGNTHTDIMSWYRQYLEGRKAWTTPFILYKEGKVAYMNTEDIQGGKERDRRWQRFFNDEHVEIIKDLIRESDLSL